MAISLAIGVSIPAVMMFILIITVTIAIIVFAKRAKRNYQAADTNIREREPPVIYEELDITVNESRLEAIDTESNKAYITVQPSE